MNVVFTHAFTWRKGRRVPVAETQSKPYRAIAVFNKELNVGAGQRAKVFQGPDGNWYAY